MTDYEKICDFQNLYRAHLKARKGKRDTLEVIRFENHLAENLTKMSRSLQARTYHMHQYYHFTIFEPKQREIFAAFYSDRVMLHCVCDQVLTPLLERRLIYDNAACRQGKGTDFALERMTLFLREHYKMYGSKGYALKCDISKYFPSIDHQILKTSLRPLVKDPDVLRLLYHVIDSYETEGMPGRGLPLGNQSSQCFAIYYLDPLDRLVKEKLRVKHYIRYNDDWILIHPDRAFLKECLGRIRFLVEEERNLTLNPKTQILPLEEGVEFLGWRFYLTETGKVVRKLRTSSKWRMKHRIEDRWAAYERGEIDRQAVRDTLVSYQAHFERGHADSLQRWLRPMLTQTEEPVIPKGEEGAEYEAVAAEGNGPGLLYYSAYPDLDWYLWLEQRQSNRAQ